MAIEVIMPKVDMDQTTGTVSEWCKKNGDHVKEGETLLIIETEKVAVDVESPGSGILDGVSAQPGDVVPIGTVIAYLLSEAEFLARGHAPAPKLAPAVPVAAPAAQPPAAPAAIPSATPVATPATGPKPASGQAATPVAKNMAAAHGIDLMTVVPSGKGPKITKADVQARLTAEPAPGLAGKAYASPAARRVAREHQVDLDALHGSGPKGRIQSNDVLAFLEVQKQAAAQPVVQKEEPPALKEAPAVQRPEPKVVPLIGMRRTIAERMTANYQSIPHIRFTSRVDMTRFGDARKKLNELAEKTGAPKISATAMFVKLVATTLKRHPMLNSSLRENEILLHSDVNIGVAVALENGLIVPVVRNADRKGLGEIAAEVNDLSARARAGKLQSSDVKGGTFTISNLGPFGIEQFDAIINAPEAAILAIAATQLEAVPDQNGQIKACPIMRMTLSADHRLVDGAVAAHFVADLKTVFEEPVLMAF